jgi:hypothetical protein
MAMMFCALLRVVVASSTGPWWMARVRFGRVAWKVSAKAPVSFCPTSRSRTSRMRELRASSRRPIGEKGR